jgi:hypothetical protein
MPVNAGTLASTITSYHEPCCRHGRPVRVNTGVCQGVASMRLFDRDRFRTTGTGSLTIPLPLLGATAGRIVAFIRMVTA